MTTPREVIDYWLGDAETDPAAAATGTKLWYGNNPEIDEEIRHRFAETLTCAEQGRLDNWQQTADGSLALVIVLDQFSRHLYRRTGDAFKNDARALAVTEAAIAGRLDTRLSWTGRAFLYHPLHHAESLPEQERAVELFESLVDEAPEEWKEVLNGFLKRARGHRDIVARFGRFPHRNRVLGRTNTEEEATWLETARSFGQ